LFFPGHTGDGGGEIMKGILPVKEQESLQECLICEQEKENGIYLLNYFICRSCEKDIVNTEADDRGYKYYLDRLKKVRNTLLEIKENKVH
jgi:hypothetical protein